MLVTFIIVSNGLLLHPAPFHHPSLQPRCRPRLDAISDASEGERKRLAADRQKLEAERAALEADILTLKGQKMRLEKTVSQLAPPPPPTSIPQAFVDAPSAEALCRQLNSTGVLGLEELQKPSLSGVMGL